MEVPELQLVGRITPGTVIELGEGVGRASRRSGAIQVGGKHSSEVGIRVVEVEVDHARRRSIEHRIALESHRSSPSPIAEEVIALELVD